MDARPLEVCPDCGVRLPAATGPTHRYLGAGPACWALYSALQGGGEPPLARGPLSPLLVDAYAAQHHGAPSNQSIQSVAVHLITLYATLDLHVDIAHAIQLRTRPLRAGSSAKHARFAWLEPPPLSLLGVVTVADIVDAPSPPARYAVLERYVHAVWDAWRGAHAAQVALWYTQFVLPDRI